MGFDFQNTSYTGAAATKAQAEELSHQPAAEYLTPVPQPDGSVVLQARLPEWGRSSKGEDFRIRANFNYLNRALAAACLDENGDPDMDKAVRLMTDLTEMTNNLTINGRIEDAQDEIASFCQVPEEHRADFIRFVMDPDVQHTMLTIAGSMSNYQGLVEKLIGFQRLMDQASDGKPHPDAEERNAIIRDSYEDYRNSLEALRELARIDPETETRVTAPLDCSDFATINEDLLTPNTRWRESRGLEPVSGEKETLRFDQTVENVQENKYAAFVGHVCFVVKYRPEGQEPQVISVETTAPPTGKMLFFPGTGHTGVGIYRSKEDLLAYHESRNLVVDPMMTAKTKLMNDSYDGPEKVTAFTKHPDYEPVRQSRGMTTEERMIWKDALKSLRDQLNASDSRFSKDSQEYKNLKQGLDELLANDWRSLDGKPPETLAPMMRHVDELAREYLEHCGDEQKIGSRRSTRMDVAQTLHELTDMAGRCARTPVEGCREAMLNKFLDFARDYQLGRNESKAYKDQVNAMFTDPTRRRAVKAQVENSQAFKALIGKGDVQTLHKLMKNPRQSYELFLANCKKYGSPENTPPRARAHAAGRREQERSLVGN